MRAVSARDARFDMIKGTLVLLMVIYHVMSIASTATAEDYRYIRFISGSFIFVTACWYSLSIFALKCVNCGLRKFSDGDAL